MRKDLGVMPAAFPMPVLMIATYNKDNTVNVMNMAWGGICGGKYIALNISETHQTSENIKMRGAFTVSIADRKHLAEADYFGIVSGSDVPEKFSHTNMSSTKSQFVDAPIVEEWPVTMECRVAKIQKDPEFGFRVIGEIMNVSAHEDVLDEDGKVDVSKVDAVAFDNFRNDYYAIGEKVGAAWGIGMELE